MGGNGVTISIIPHGGRPSRQWRLDGGRLLLLRAGVVFTIVIILVAISIVAFGFARSVGSGSLRARVEELEDSLASAREIEARLDSIETVLEEIGAVRERLENISEHAGQ